MEAVRRLVPFLDLFSTPRDSQIFIPLVIASAVIGIIALGCISFTFVVLWRSGRCTRAIGRVRSKLDRLHKEDISRNYDEIRNDLESDPDYGHLWKEFDETIVRVKSADGKVQLYNSFDAKYFFSESAVLDPFLNLRLFATIPSLLTGLGILGTFLGLTYGLSQIDLATEDIDVLRGGISALLAGATTAFSTSVWGILASIVFSVFEKRRVQSLLIRVRKLQRHIDSVFTRRTAQYFLAEALEEQRHHTQQLRRFNEDLALSIAEALDEKMAERLTPATRELLSAVQELRDFKSESTTEALDKLVKSVSTTVTEGAGGQIEHLGSVLSRVSEVIDRSSEEGVRAQDEMRRTFHEHTNSMRETVDALMDNVESHQRRVSERILEETEALSDRLSSMIIDTRRVSAESSAAMKDEVERLSSALAEKLDGVSSRYEEERDALVVVLEDLKIIHESLTKMNTRLERTATALADAAEPISGSISELRRGMEALRESHARLMSAAERVQADLSQQNEVSQATLTQMRTALETTEAAWRAYEGNFTGLRDDLDGVFGSIRRGLSDYSTATQENVEKLLDGMDQHFTDAVGTLGGAIENLQETLEEWADEDGGAEV